MARKQQSNADYPFQLPLADFLAQLDANPGQPFQVPVTSKDIGGELLAILSRGLYPSPLDCIREYVQNSVDGGAKTVSIKVTGNSVYIRDDGSGMSVQGLHAARKFAVSPKPIGQFIGFRGIGIYSSYDICSRLIINTKQVGDQFSHILDFDFKGMKSKIDAEKRTQGSPVTSLDELLTQFSTFKSQSVTENFIEQSYTIVQLEDLSSSHIGTIKDRDKLKNYVLRNLPIDFEEGFEFKDLINQRLRENVPGYNAVLLRLEVNNDPVQVIARQAIPNLRHPDMNLIKNQKTGEVIGYYWACLHSEGKIPDTFKDYQGFVYKVKGFTIGDNSLLNDVMKTGGGVLYKWYTGEIYVLDAKVVPNSARDNFEPSPEKDNLELAVNVVLGELQKNANQYREGKLAEKKLENFQRQISDLENRVSEGEYDSDRMLNIHRDLQNLKEELEKLSKQKKVTDKQSLATTSQRVTKLLSLVKNAISRQQDIPRQASVSPIIEIPTTDSTNLNNEEELLPSGYLGELPLGNNFMQTQVPPAPAPLVPMTSPLVRTLASVFEEAEFDLSSDLTQMIDIFDTALREVLSYQSPRYQQILDYIEAKLIEME